MTEAPAKTPLALGRVTLRLLSPLSLASGDLLTRGKDDEAFTFGALMRDANGLPMIPAASWQGALRHLWCETYDNPEEIFGHEAAGGKGQAGRVTFGFGHVLDATGKAVVALRPKAALKQDAVLAVLLEEDPVRRNHVRLGDRHSVDGRGKHARAAVPAGVRFSMEASAWGEDAEDLLRKLFGLMASDSFRLGGATARGYGRVELASAAVWRPAMSTGEDLETLRKARRQPPSAAFPGQERRNDPKDLVAPPASAAVVTVRLSPSRVFRIGSGSPGKLTAETRGFARFDGQEAKNAALAAITDSPAVGHRIKDKERGVDNLAGLYGERRLVAGADAKPESRWIDGRETLSAEGLPVPGSALRGPISHRTLFHLRRLKGCFIGTDGQVSKPDPAGDLAALFGDAKTRTGADGKEGGQAARLIVEDGVLTDPVAVQVIDHVGIDRFTGGVRNGLLFAEEVVVCDERTAITFRMVVRPAREGAAHHETVLQALGAALADLCAGRLPIGSDSLGLCTGSVSVGGAKTLKASLERAFTKMRVPFAGGGR